MNRLVTSLLALSLLAGISGAVQGQTHFTAKMTGTQEVPPVITGASGTAFLTLTTAGLQFSLTVDGLSGPITAAHFHNAAPGVAGGVVRTITTDFQGNTAQGIWTSTDAQPLTTALITEVARGNVYLNVHTAANPGGEIRGQVDLSDGTHFTATLAGTQENPPLGVAGTGTGSATFTEEGLAYKLTVTGLTGAIAAAHIHQSPIGVNGGVFQSILPTFVGNTASGFIPRASFTPAQLRALIAGDMYFNVHTAANPGGEIRGQLVLHGGIGFSAPIDQGQEVPPSGSPGTGSASFTLTPAGLLFDITATAMTGPITLAHFHNAPAGVNGGVVRTITTEFAGTTTAVGLWRADDAEPLTPLLISELLAGRLYVNLHTAAFGGGEIRGQVNLNTSTANTTFTANLTPEQEEPPLAGAARGTATLMLGAGGLAYRVTVNGLSGAITAAHFHNGLIGVAGGVANNILPSFVGNTATGVWALAPADVTNLLLGRIYLNVHTAANPGGEIRGQVLAASGAEEDGRLTGPQEVPPVATPGLGTASYRLTRDGLTFHFTVDGLSGAITAAHFHNAPPGVAGGVVRGIAPAELAGNTGAGVWKPTDASPLTPALVTQLLRGNIYLNLHTAANPAGETRAQVKLAGGAGAGNLLIGGAQVPPVATDGMGVLAVTLTDVGLVFRTTVSDLSSGITSADLHNAPVGLNGPMVRDITAEFAGTQTGDGVWGPADAMPLTLALTRELVLGNIYEQVHTVNFPLAGPGGEVRGQIPSLYAAGSGVSSVGDLGGSAASLLQLSNFPNPFAGSTVVSFFLPQSSEVQLRVYDAAGREVSTLLDGTREAGWHRTPFDASRVAGLPSGIYLYRLEAGSNAATGKMLKIR